MSSEQQNARRGGRAARNALRAAPLSDDIKPVRPGMPSGRYKVLTDAEVLKIHEAALNVLENIGLADPIQSTLDYLLPKGCKLDSNGRLLFPRSLIEDTIAMAGRNFPLYAQDPKYDMEPWGTNTYFGTAGAAVYIADPETGDYRESTAQDAYDIARLVDRMEHLHFYQRAVVPRDIPEAAAMDINTCYLSVSGTTKHVGTSWVHPDHLIESLKMLHEIAGGEDKWRARPFVSQSNCFVVPPLKFASDACKCLEVAVLAGMPVLLLSAGQAGATAPAAIAGALVQQVAECLAGLAYVNAIIPGAPAIFGLWCFVSDLRSGAMSGGSPEQVLLSAASAQMAHFYNLTGGTSSGISDAKFPDAQSGSEKGINHALVGNAGMNLIYEAAGMHGSLLGYSLEGVVLDNDTIGSVQRTIRGIQVTDESLSIETMRAQCIDGPGHYLGAEQTLRIMQSEYLYPAVGDRLSSKEWKEVGSPKINDVARKKVKEILDSHYPDHIPESVDANIRTYLDIRLARENMVHPNKMVSA